MEPDKQKPTYNEILKGIKRSLQHWRNMRDNRWSRSNTTVSHCALCSIFHNNIERLSCLRCPIFIKTDRKYCEGTPCKDINDRQYNRDDEDMNKDFSAMVDFLTELYIEWLENKPSITEEFEIAIEGAWVEEHLDKRSEFMRAYEEATKHSDLNVIKFQDLMMELIDKYKKDK